MLSAISSESDFAWPVEANLRWIVGLLVLFAGALSAPANAAIVVDPMATGATNVFFGIFGPQVSVTNPVPDPLNSPPSTSVLLIGRTSPGWLEINGGSKANLQTIWVAGDAGATGHLTVTGSGSELNAGNLDLGSLEAGLLQVSAGADVDVNSLNLRSTPAGIPSVMVMSGSGTVVEAQGAVSVSGNSQIHTSGGAMLKADYVYVGQFSSQEGEVAEANVFGLGTKWEILNELHVGDGGPGELTITGSEILANEAFLGGAGAPVALSLQNGTLDATDLYVAANSIQGNGTVSTKGIIADLPLIFDATHGLQQDIPIAGQPLAKIALDHSHPARLGAGYRGNGSLTISAGRVVQSSFGVLGFGSNSFGQASITGAGTKWQIENQLDVGAEGKGELTIGAGAAVDVEFDVYLDLYAQNPDSRIIFNGGEMTAQSINAAANQLQGTGTIHAKGFQLDGDIVFDQPGLVPPDFVLDDLPGQHVTIDFETPEWGAVGVGYQDSGSLQIRNGAKLVSSAGQLGGNYESRGTAIVEGPGSEWRLPGGLLRIGAGGATGELRVADGGLVEGERVSLESGAKLEISGVNARLQAAQLEVFNFGQQPFAIHVHSGGSLSVDNVYVSDSNPSQPITAAQLIVEDEGSKFSFGGASLGTMLVHLRDGGTMEGGHALSLDDAIVHLDGGTLDANGSDIDIDRGAILFEAGTLRNFQRYRGNLWQAAGRVELDTPFAEIQGNYYQDADAEIQLTLSNQTNQPALTVDGSALIAGSLEVVAVNPLPMSPQANGNAYLVFEATRGILGEFEDYVLPELATGLGWSVIQTSNQIYLQVIAGDYNGNGIIDAADYALWRDSKELGLAIEKGTGADGNRDGFVNQADYDIWKQFFGQRIMGAAGSGANSSIATSSSAFSVPEPTGALLLISAGFCLLPAARRRPV